MGKGLVPKVTEKEAEPGCSVCLFMTYFFFFVFPCKLLSLSTVPSQILTETLWELKASLISDERRQSDPSPLRQRQTA